MRPKYLFGILLLLSIGVIVVLFVRAVPREAAALVAAPAPPLEKVLVAARPLPAALFLRAQDVTWGAREGDSQAGEIVQPSTEVRPPEPQTPEPKKAGLLSKPNAKNAPAPKTDDAVRAGVYGAALRKELAEGEPIRTFDIVKPGDRDFLPTVLRDGRRAQTIPVTGDSIGTALMFPGDHVDVMLTQTFKNDSAPLTRRSVSETVVEDLRVLAIQAPPKTGTARVLSVTLEVLPAQAEKVNVAIELGKLSLSLRSVNEPAVAATTAPPAPQAPTWAGDVSPALKSAVPPPKVVQAERPAVKVMRGPNAIETKTNSETKTQ
jgi:pilus assembly protein CpaB